jgi:adenosylmethionine-8-amino-7-oxononanoate aminotransferase
MQRDNRVIVRGSGFYLVDDKGRRYLDGTASMWCNVWGHGNNPVVEAMRTQLRELQHSTLFGLASKPSTLLGETLVNLAKGMERVFYTDNGSTAIEAALKMALQYWRNKEKRDKKEFVSLRNGYHGDTIGAMSVGYIERFFGAYRPLLASRVHRIPSPLLYHSNFRNTKELAEWCLEQAESLLRKRRHQCAALVMESGAQIAGGAIIYPPGFQRELSKLCSKNDVLLILDEIATGFGRLGNMIEYRSQGSVPDIVCFGKALTAGYFPLAVTMTSDRIFNSFLGDYSENKQFYHGHTFTGHPVGCAAALANIRLYKRRNLIRNIKGNSNYIASRLKEFEKSAIVADIRHKGMLGGIELARKGRRIQFLQDGERVNYFIMRRSLEMGVHLRPLGNIMMITPPLAIDRKNLGTLLDVQLDILREIERNVTT